MWTCLNDHAPLLQAIAALIGIPIGLATVWMLVVTWRAVKRQSIAADRQSVAADRQAEAAENSANLTIQQIGQNLATADKASEPLLRFDLDKHQGIGHIYNDGKGTAFDINVDYTDDFPRHARIVETFLAPQKQAQISPADMPTNFSPYEVCKIFIYLYLYKNQKKSFALSAG
jgi:hypothetical protein